MIICAADRVADSAVIADIPDVGAVGEAGPVSKARVLSWIDLSYRLCVADDAAGLQPGLYVAGRRSVTTVTFGMRRNESRDLPLSGLVTAGAIETPSVGELVPDMGFVLLCVEKYVVVVPLWKIALRRARAEGLFAAMADPASLERAGSELDNMALDTRAMSRKRQVESFVARCVWNYRTAFERSFVTVVALQFADFSRPRYLDQTQM